MTFNDLLDGLLDMGHFQARNEARRQLDEEADLVHTLEAQLRNAQRKSNRLRNQALRRRKYSKRNKVQEPQKGNGAPLEPKL